MLDAQKLLMESCYKANDKIHTGEVFMANTKRKSTKKAPAKKTQEHGFMGDVILVVLIVVSLLFLIALFNKNSGIIGQVVRNVGHGLFGNCIYIIPFLLMAVSIVMFVYKDSTFHYRHWALIGMILIISALFYCQSYYDGNYGFDLGGYYRDGMDNIGGGAIGGLIGYALTALFGNSGCLLILIAGLVVTFIIISGKSIIGFFAEKYENREPREKKPVVREKGIVTPLGETAPKTKGKYVKLSNQYDLSVEENKKKEAAVAVLEPLEPETSEPQIEFFLDNNKKEAKKPAEKAEKQVEKLEIKSEQKTENTDYTYPPVSLLKDNDNDMSQNEYRNELKKTSDKLTETLKNFGVDAKVININSGPTVTRYEVKPGQGVKVSKIVNLADDISLNLASFGIRIAPIPGKTAVGIEVPNTVVLPVYIKDCIDTSEFRASKSKVSFALGKDITGRPVIADIAKMPHMLIAGATGSGKSVCINSIIISLLYKADPSEVQLLMIDPKVVELGIYNGIPHLLTPVVTEPRKASGALCWAVAEMVNRYKLFADNNVRDIRGYNALAGKTEGMEKLTQIVIIIDELADLMMVAPNEVEDSICRLAQMARAAGMHLIIATQRPSVDVITGIIKANIPSRISFAVSSQIDSRTILDMAGAEKLLGKGDMLYHPIGESKPIRVQGSFISDKEVEAVVEFVKEHFGTAQYDEDIIEKIENGAAPEKSSNDEEEEADGLLPEAIEIVVERQEASTSMLQRKLRVGYARAGRLIDEMEKRGIIGQYEGSKPRQVNLTKTQWLEMKMSNEEMNSDSQPEEKEEQTEEE